MHQYQKPAAAPVSQLDLLKNCLQQQIHSSVLASTANWRQQPTYGTQATPWSQPPHVQGVIQSAPGNAHQQLATLLAMQAELNKVLCIHQPHAPNVQTFSRMFQQPQCHTEQHCTNQGVPRLPELQQQGNANGSNLPAVFQVLAQMLQQQAPQQSPPRVNHNFSNEHLLTILVALQQQQQGGLPS